MLPGSFQSIRMPLRWFSGRSVFLPSFFPFMSDGGPPFKLRQQEASSGVIKVYRVLGVKRNGKSNVSVLPGPTFYLVFLCSLGRQGAVEWKHDRGAGGREGTGGGWRCGTRGAAGAAA
jgi:hypothetical protein